MMRAALLTFVLIGCHAFPSAAADDSAQRPMVPVRIIDEARVPRHILDDALVEASRIYRGVGVELLWVAADEQDPQPSFVIKLVKKSLGGPTANDRAFAIAPRTANRRGRHAWVFYTRIQDRAEVLRVSGSILLGAVLAHELGHLLLLGDAGSEIGLMRRVWDGHQIQKAMWGLLMFSPDEAARIRSTLRDDDLRLAD